MSPAEGVAGRKTDVSSYRRIMGRSGRSRQVARRIGQAAEGLLAASTTAVVRSRHPIAREAQLR
jgi:hypothetical protein